MPNPTISSLTLPVKNPSTGVVTNVTYDLPSGGGGGVNVDDEISSSSENPVQNKVIAAALDNKVDSSSLGTAATRDVPTSGNANVTQVVLGSDTRLTNARNAADVYDWAKEATKPSYTALEVGAIATTAKGANNGVAELDATGKVPSSQLPSYVDDVLEYSSQATFPTTGETGKIYVALDSNKTYRWSGTEYVVISETIALGETSSTAYRGDRGKTAYDHSQTTSGNPHNVTASDVGLGNVGNFKAVSTVASQGLSDGEKSAARANIGAGTSNFDGAYSSLSGKPTIPTKVSDLTNDSGYITNQDISGKADKPTVKSQSLAANETSVTFTGIPTSGNNMIDFFITDGSNYTAINTATAGQIILTYAASSSARTVYCRIEGV